MVKLFLRHPLHAKLYLLFRPDPIAPTIGYLGSSNLTLPGLSKQGELNVDVLDQDACAKLAQWFDDRWDDQWCIDISQDLAKIIDTSWAREEMIPPHHIYVKIAYHLCQEARAGLSEFRIPNDFGNKLLDFQVAAVKIAAHHLNKRGGVLVGDVVGLGKTLIATALARIFEDDHGLETLIISPKNLVRMWEDYHARYRLRGRVLSLTQVQSKLPKMRRHRLVLIDESHNLRNREGKRYRAIKEYIRANDSRVILLSATPYNKSYSDLASQLRLFVRETDDLGIRPEALLQSMGETEFLRQHQASPQSLAAFEKSDYPDDWRDLMRLHLVRRTRTFVQDNYAQEDPSTGRRYLTFGDGTRSYFPTRVPRTLRFTIHSQYAQMFSESVVDTINDLNLARYGLGDYVREQLGSEVTSDEKKTLANLSRAGRRLMGFCRTNLFKRLESSGHSFFLSVERHLFRNFIFLHAIHGEDQLPIGSPDAVLLDFLGDVGEDAIGSTPSQESAVRSIDDFRQHATNVYSQMATIHRTRYRWLPSSYFTPDLRQAIEADTLALYGLLMSFGQWNASADKKVDKLAELVTCTHGTDKVLVFTQFADTAHYLERELKSRSVPGVLAVTGKTDDPTAAVCQFSPRSNQVHDAADGADQIRVLVATDVLSEGQNLQDCAVVVNYDLPWAIIRLIQRVGRVDRIGQQATDVQCYSFLPDDGIERLIQLRARVRQRLDENAEVVGTDETFFENDDSKAVLDLYHEKAGVLDGDGDAEVDLASYAYQIWRNATAENPGLKKVIEDMPSVVFSAKSHRARHHRLGGVLVYARTVHGYDSLVWIDSDSKVVTGSQLAILQAAACEPNTTALPRDERHHHLVRRGMQHLAKMEQKVGGQLGRPSGARFRVYERLKRYAAGVRGTVFDTEELRRAIADIYRCPLRPAAVDALNRQLKAGIDDHDLAEIVVSRRSEGTLTIEAGATVRITEPEIICSLGLVT